MGMVVRTNTMALNAYRQLGMNNSAVAKSLEKLSSGFRINRAGDDAAGLAISEKMKAQITGLETAAANAQDGISLIQTAEGNLTEVHSMLNRMVELATKSANGTYTQTERDALQSEVKSLQEEINRISKSANFNGTNLLDGSMDDTIKDSSTLKLGNFTAANTSMILPGVEKNTAGTDGTTAAGGTTAANGTSATKEPVKTSFAIDLNDLDITWDKAKNSTGDVTFSVNFGRKTAVDPNADTGAKKDIVLNFTYGTAAAKALFNDDGSLNVDKLAQAMATDLTPANDADKVNYDEEGYWKARLDIAGVGSEGDPDSYSGFNVKVDTETNQLLFKLDNIDNAKEAELNLNWNNISDRIRFDVIDKTDATNPETVGTDKVSINLDGRVNGWKDGMQDPSGVIGTNTIVYNNVGETSKTNFFVNLKDIDWTDAVSAIDSVSDADAATKSFMLKIDFGAQYIDANGKPQSTIVGINFSAEDWKKFLVDSDNDGKNDSLSLEKLLAAVDKDLKDNNLDVDSENGFRADIAGVADHTKENLGYSGFDFKSEGTGFRFILHDPAIAHPSEANANWGDVSISFLGSDKAVADAGTADYTTVIAGGDGYNSWSVGTTDMHDGVLPGQNSYANTVLDIKATGFDIDNAANNDGYTISADGKTFVLAVGDDSAVAKADLGDSGAIVVKVNKGASVDKQLQELANAMNKNCETWEVGATDRNSTANYGLSFKQYKTGATATDKAGHDLTTVEGIAGSFSFGKADVKNVTAGKALNLQIGDTSDSFNKMEVSIKDMSAAGLNLDKLDITTEESASEAIKNIKDAINTVSSQRAVLGALQNRLEHTINNLDVSVENLSAANSRIRDTDMAKEMMNYTKMNVLVQSAQAMLAQANQQPQSVLQLLQ